MIGPVIIQHDKSTPSHDTALWCTAKKLGLEREDVCIIIEDEQHDACNTCFKKSTLLRCTKHFERNCREDLKTIGALSSTVDNVIRYCFG